LLEAVLLISGGHASVDEMLRGCMTTGLTRNERSRAQGYESNFLKTASLSPRWVEAMPDTWLVFASIRYTDGKDDASAA
jgi:hypothetical protein